MKILVVIQVLMLFFILSANLAIIFVIYNMDKGTKNRRNRSTRIFKLSLALADLLLGLSTLPAALEASIGLLRGEEEYLSSSLRHVSTTSVATPKAIILGSGCIIATISSIWSILAIQVDIFLKLRWPIMQRTGKLITTRRVGSATCLLKTGSETGFLAQSLDRLLDRDFQGPISDRKAEQIFKTETGF